MFVALPAPPAAPAATLVDEARFNREQRGSKVSVALTLAVIEDANDSLAEFRGGKAKGDLIVADGKTFGAALRVLEKNSLIEIADRERIACAIGDDDRHEAELSLPNPTTRLKPTQTEPTQVSVRRIEKDIYAVRLEFRRTVDGNEDYQSIEMAMRLGDVKLHECTSAAGDATADAKSYLMIQLAAEGDKNATIEPSPAAASKKASLIEGQPPVQFMLERRFVPTLRNPKKPKPTSAEGSGEGDAIEAAPSKPRAIGAADYRLQPFDTIKLRVERPHRLAHTLTWGDIGGEFTVDHHGELNLGFDLSEVRVVGLTVDEARVAIARQLRKKFPNCIVHLTTAALAAEKYVVSIERVDGTEAYLGAQPAGRLSRSGFVEWSQFTEDLGPDVLFELHPASSSQRVDGPIKLSKIWDAVLAPGATATNLTAGPGDRLVITVANEYRPAFLPYWLEPCDAASERALPRFRTSAAPGWSALYSTQFDHPDVQLPAGPKYSR